MSTSHTGVSIAPRTGAPRIFLDLSAALTGFSHVELLATGMLDVYYDETNLIVGERELGKLLGELEQAGDDPDAVLARILDDDRYGPVARNIIRMWYLGTWKQLPLEWRNRYGATSFDTDHVVSGDAYREGLVWVAGEAHPMGAKQQGFGAWAEPGPDASDGRS